MGCPSPFPPSPLPVLCNLFALPPALWDGPGCPQAAFASMHRIVIAAAAAAAHPEPGNTAGNTKHSSLKTILVDTKRSVPSLSLRQRRSLEVEDKHTRHNKYMTKGRREREREREKRVKQDTEGRKRVQHRKCLRVSACC